jgi:hypothetical protein
MKDDVMKLMNLADAERLAEQLAMAQYLSDWGDSTYDEVVESMNNGVIPDDVYVWEVIENEAPEVVISMIEGLRNEFLYFYNRVIGV